MAFVALHGPLGLLIYSSSYVSALHAVGTLIVGLGLALTGRRRYRVACVGAYIVGAEVLWRMSRTPIFYEFGKYAIVAIFLLAILRSRRRSCPPLLLLYFALLLPSVVLTLMELFPSDARQEISFNLSGPLALTVCGWFFSNLKLSGEHLRLMLLTGLSPIVGIMTVTVYSTLTSSFINFGTESNFATSGGFGPNQVSAILGFGALFAFFCLFGKRMSRGIKVSIFIIMMLFLVQSSLTFSRGGFYNFIGGAVAALFFLLRDRGARIRSVVIVAVFVLATVFVVLPGLNRFTGGTLLNRFQDTDLTGRDQIAAADLQTWMEHPILGVGPGQGDAYRATRFRVVTAHTEFTRLLAEHGTFGLIAMFCLFYLSGQQLLRAHTIQGKALVAAMICWSFLYMLGAAMRLAAPGFAFGLTFAFILPAESAIGWLMNPASDPPNEFEDITEINSPLSAASPMG